MGATSGIRRIRISPLLVCRRQKYSCPGSKVATGGIGKRVFQPSAVVSMPASAMNASIACRAWSSPALSDFWAQPRLPRATARTSAQVMRERVLSEAIWSMEASRGMAVVRAVVRSVPGRHAAKADAPDDRTPDLDGSA
jgi:hypothetical protein